MAFNILVFFHPKRITYDVISFNLVYKLHLHVGTLTFSGASMMAQSKRQACFPKTSPKSKVKALDTTLCFYSTCPVPR